MGLNIYSRCKYELHGVICKKKYQPDVYKIPEIKRFLAIHVDPAGAQFKLIQWLHGWSYCIRRFLLGSDRVISWFPLEAQIWQKFANCGIDDSER